MKKAVSEKIKKIPEIFNFLISDLADTDFFGVCYQTAFYILLTFFPLVIFLINFVGNLIQDFESFMYSFLGGFLPNLVFDTVKALIEKLKLNVGNDNIIFLILAFVFASLTVRTVINGLSQNSRNHRPLVSKRNWLMIMLITFLFCLSLVFIIAEYIVLNFIVTRIFAALDLNQWIISVTMGFSNVFAGLALFLVFLILYTLTSPPEMKMRHNIPGTALSLIILIVFFRIYLYIANHSIRFTLFYGNLGGFFLFMVVIYFSSVIINIGCKCNLYLYCFRYRNGLLFPI